MALGPEHVERQGADADRAVLVPERDRLDAPGSFPDPPAVLQRSRPSRLVPVAVDLAPGNAPAHAASTHGADVEAALLTGWDFEPSARVILKATLDGVPGDPWRGAHARRAADGDGRAERRFELRARTAEGVTLVGFGDATIAGKPGVGPAANADVARPRSPVDSHWCESIGLCCTPGGASTCAGASWCVQNDMPRGM